MKGALFHELQVLAPAAKVWDIYGTLRLAELSTKLVPSVIERFDVVEGDGGVGTVLKVFLAAGFPGPRFFLEKFVVIDGEKRIKEAKQVGGGYLELGFESYGIRFEIVEKDGDSCVIKSTVEYEIGEGSTADASFVTTEGVAALAEGIGKHLTAKCKVDDV